MYSPPGSRVFPVYSPSGSRDLPEYSPSGCRDSPEYSPPGSRDSPEFSPPGCRDSLKYHQGVDQSSFTERLAGVKYTVESWLTLHLPLSFPLSLPYTDGNGHEQGDGHGHGHEWGDEHLNLNRDNLLENCWLYISLHIYLMTWDSCWKNSKPKVCKSIRGYAFIWESITNTPDSTNILQNKNKIPFYPCILGPGEIVQRKKTETKNSWHCPFNHVTQEHICLNHVRHLGPLRCWILPMGSILRCISLMGSVPPGRSLYFSLGCDPFCADSLPEEKWPLWGTYSDSPVRACGPAVGA
jgi:hypothetical protein